MDLVPYVDCFVNSKILFDSEFIDTHILTYYIFQEIFIFTLYQPFIVNLLFNKEKSQTKITYLVIIYKYKERRKEKYDYLFN